jgi:hypothetical protein
LSSDLDWAAFVPHAPFHAPEEIAHQKIVCHKRIMLSSGGKGQLFDFLRVNGPISDPDLDAILLRLFSAGTDDLWLAQTIVQHGPEPLWPITAYDERRIRQRDHGWADEAGHIEGSLMTTTGGRNVNAYFFPGTSDERALVIGGVHGSGTETFDESHKCNVFRQNILT